MKKVLVLFALTFALPAWALNVQNHRYYFHGGRADTLVESLPKPMDTLTLGLGMTLALNPFELGNATGGNQGIVDAIFTWDMGASYSFSDRMALGINVPVHVTRNLISFTGTAKETVFSLGDMSLAAQYTAIDRASNPVGFGLGIIPYITFPTGVSANFIGDSSVTGGFLLALDWESGSNYAGLNLGVRFRQEENNLNLRVAQEMIYTAVYARPLVEAIDLAIFGEIAGSTVMNEFFQNENSSPVELKLGLSKIFLPDRPVTAKIVQGVGLGNGYGNPDYRAVLSLSYDHGMPKTQVIEKTVTIERVQKVEQRLKELTIYYPTDGDQVDPFYDQKIAGIADVMKDNPDMRPLYIVGHTDDVGNDDYNLKLSARRARQAYDSIIQHGLDPTSVVWFGVGETDPVAANISAENRALNRRTVFTFRKPRSLIGGGIAAPSPAAPRSGSETNSYTEILKRRESQGFVDDNVKTEAIETGEEVRIKEETVVREPNEDVAPKRKKKSFRSGHKKSKKNDYQEQTLDEKDSFDEPFVE